MKAKILCLLLLLSACTDSDIPYDYSVGWECASPEGCERSEDVRWLDRLNIFGDTFVFLSKRNESFSERAQRLGSEGLPAGCSWLHSFTMFGNVLEPSKLCSTSGGYDLELSIPNRNPATHSQWNVSIREFGLL